MYYIHNYIEDTWRSTKTWWDLVEYFYRPKVDYFGFKYFFDDGFDNIAHSKNDTKLSYVPISEGSYATKAVYVPRSEIIYNDDMVIVNIADIKRALKVFKPREESYPYKSTWMRRGRYFQFEFRVDPVPYVGTGRGGGSSYRKPKRNKNYFAKLQEFEEFDSRVRKGIFDVSLWWDDFPYRGTVKSWKNKKKKKQWM